MNKKNYNTIYYYITLIENDWYRDNSIPRVSKL